MSIFEDIQKRILILDGAMGTMLQRGMSEEETLQAYVDAGADIITTNSFSANRISQADTGLADKAAAMAYESAVLARKVADRADRKVYVAGSVGPTSKSLTLSSDATDPAFRQYDFDYFTETYKEQIDALVRGGADLILIETCFDALNAKAAIQALELLDSPVPAIVSATVSDRSGRTLTGQTLEAFYQSISHAPGLLAFGVNCALGAAAMAPLVKEISSFSSHAVSFHPNAGIPDELGRYGDSPEMMATVARTLAMEGCVNIVGGCCGTSPEHIKAIAESVKGIAPRISGPRKGLTVSGLEAVPIDKSRNFTNIGERTNVAGSRKFARLVAAGQWDEAIGIAAAQIEGGADIIDINMDDPMVDSSEKMRTFLRHISGEPAVAKAAIMIDSSHWDTIVEGLKNVQGKSIVNSISLKDGEEEFIRKALTIKSLGAAMVVMAFDEEGQAVTFGRKIEICRRSYGLLTAAGIPADDIIFDVNVLSIGTGIPEHSRFGVDFIEAVRWIKANLPGARTSGGISNLSFSFRGNNAVREAMHSVFLYHAVKAGLDMAIVNPQMLRIYDELDPDLREAVEDVIFDKDADATSRLVAKASEMLSESPEKEASAKVSEVECDPEERLSDAVVKGLSEHLSEDAIFCLEKLGSAVSVIEGPLMRGMEKVGELFGDGRMFLPQVVKSAKIMREAVKVLQPYMDSENSSGSKPKFVIATVQGDVHDIGKNITSIVLQCSGFDVTDLGVMVPCTTLLDKAQELGADIIGVSGLITPSLQRMEEICREMKARGMSVPLFVGGAAASAVHTAVKLAPLYENVHYGTDASASAVLAKKYISDPSAFRMSENEAHRRIVALHAAASGIACPCCTPGTLVREGGFVDGMPFKDIEIQEFGWGELEYCFDWRLFSVVCGTGKADCDTAEAYKSEAVDYISKNGLKARVSARFFSCHREDDSIVGDGIALPMLRDGHSLADYFPVGGNSPLGIFAVRVTGPEIDSTDNPVGHAARAALAEAASEHLQRMWKSELPEGVRLIAPGIGYACCPDHSLKRDILGMLSPEMDIRLTESCAMIPEASICGLVIAHRDAAYRNIRKVSSAGLDAYAALRGFSAGERALFLSHLEG